jgi:hypothetical protein
VLILAEALKWIDVQTFKGDISDSDDNVADELIIRLFPLFRLVLQGHIPNELQAPSSFLIPLAAFRYDSTYFLLRRVRFSCLLLIILYLIVGFDILFNERLVVIIQAYPSLD